MDKFKKIYIEISNICNLQCSFCPIVERDKAIMSVELFDKVIKEVSPFTNEISLHLMGEPLAHPQFSEILKITERNFFETGVQINLTTNGILLNKYKAELLKNKSLRQMNFSINSFKDNFKDRDINPYLEDILNFTQQVQDEREDFYINFRLWNIKSHNQQEDVNLPIIKKMSSFFNVELNDDIDVGNIKSKRIFKKVYFHFDSRFEWPSKLNPIISEVGSCHGLSGHIGIHANGIVVPCCLDKEALIDLGTLQTETLSTILMGKKAQAIKNGFRQKKLVDDLCQRCTYIKRFQ